MDEKIEKNNILEIFRDENGNAFVKGHSVEESEKIIRSLIKKSDDSNDASSQSEPEKQEVVVITGDKENTIEKKDFHGQKFVIDGGILRIFDDLDPVIEINAGGLLIYDGYTVELSEQQKKNLATAYENCTVAFDDCYFNEPINIDCPEVCIDGGAFTDVNYGDEHEAICFTSKYATMNIVNGAHIDNLHVGVNRQVQTNYESGDEPLVSIDHVDIEGNGGFAACKILSMTVRQFARVEIYGKVNHMCVSGTAYIGKAAEVYEVHLHAGGVIYGKVDDIDITSDRPFRVVTDKNGTWIIG